MIRNRQVSAWPVQREGFSLYRIAYRVLMIPVVVAVAAALVAVGLSPAVGGAGTAIKRFDDKFLGDGEGLEIPDFPQRSTIHASDGRVLATVADYNRIYVPLDKVNQVTRNAILAIEDARFYEHGPIDPVAIVRAGIDNLLAGEVISGASTISQQLVKNTVTGGEQTFERKFKEAQAAIRLERAYTKNQILELYLNQVYFGHGTYGIGAAAEYYFAKRPADLTIEQAALLAGMISAPATWDPVTNRPGALTRRNYVLRRMLELDWIDRAEYAKAAAARIRMSKKKRTVNKYGPQPYFVDYVRQQILHPPKDDPQYKQIRKVFGRTVRQRERALYQGGLKIYTTLDRRMQRAAKETVERRLPNPGKKPPDMDPAASVVTIASRNGAILTMYGGKDFSKKQFNLATQARRGAGSAFKAFTLVAALEKGIPPGKVYDSKSPTRIDPDKCPDPDGVWEPSNAEGGGGGYMPLTTATANSVNVVFAQLIADIPGGPAYVSKVASRMGVRSYASNAKVSVPPVCAITLGSVEVSPLAMTSGFATLASGGVHCRPFAIRKVVSAQGKTIFRTKPSCKRRVDPAIAAQATSMLRGVVQHGTGTVANIGRPVAGKTGTGQDYKDAWFMGYIPQLVTGVWVGYTEREYEMRGLRVLGGRNAFGGSIAAPIWGEYMRVAVEGMAVKDFPTPPPQKAGIVPNVVGLMEQEAEDVLADADFTAIPQEVESHEPPGTVVAQSPTAGARVTLGSGVTIFVSNGRGPPPEKRIRVPDVVGLEEQEAKKILRDAGFKVAVVEVPSDPQDEGKVVAQEPPGGSRRKRGSTVTIFVGIKAQPGPGP
ncbi:MAG: PBP1A family penicillin-binding protein [Actinomycetota bacterium]